MLAVTLLGSLGAGHATLPPTCQPNSRPPTDSVTLAPNYFSCASKRLAGKYPIRSWVRRTGCVDLTTGAPLDCDLCVGSWVDPGSELGHQHDPQRGSKVFYARGTVWSDTQPFSELFTSTGFTLRTLRGKPRVVFTAPEAAARVRLSAWAFLHERDYRFVCAPHTPGERWTCPDPSRTQASYDFAMNFLPAIDNRAQLPASSTCLRCDYFYKCRATGQDSQGNPPHGSNMYGEAGFLKALQALAASFRAFRDEQGNQPFQHYKLMIGDISPERGGVFDLNQDWSPPTAGTGSAAPPTSPATCGMSAPTRSGNSTRIKEKPSWGGSATTRGACIAASTAAAQACTSTSSTRPFSGNRAPLWVGPSSRTILRTCPAPGPTP